MPFPDVLVDQQSVTFRPTSREQVVFCCHIWLSAQHAYRKTAKVRMLMGKSAGGFSGGTIASLMGAMFDETPEELRLAADPYALNPPNDHR